MVKTKKTVDLINGDIDNTLRQLAMPLIIGFVLHMANGIVDMFWVSKLGDTALAALGVSEQLTLFYFTLGIGFAIGTGVVVARRIGEGDKKAADETATQALFTMFLYAIFVAIAFYFARSSILDIIGYEGTKKIYAMRYLSGIVYGIPFLYIIIQLNAIVRSTGNTVYPMYIVAFTVGINAILTPLLMFDTIFEGGWGIFGSGFATAIAQLLGMLISLRFVFKGLTPITLDFRKFKPEYDIIRRIIKRGFHSTLQYLSVSINRIALFAIANQIGGFTDAAFTIGLKFDLLTFMPMFATGVSLEIISGQNRGADKIDRIFKYFRSAVKQISFILIPMMIVAIFFGKYFAMIFTKEESIILLTQDYLRVTSLSYMFFAVGIFTTRVISGAGDTLRSFILHSAMLVVVQLPLIYFLSIHLSWGASGLYWGIFASYLIFTVLGLITLYRKSWYNVKL